MAPDTLTARLTSLSNAHKLTVQLISRLAKLPIQPGSSALNPEEADARVELSAEIHQSLKDQDEELELLRQEVEDCVGSGISGGGRRGADGEKDRERARLGAQVTRLEEDLKFARTQFRKAQLQAKRNAELARRKERELLLAGAQEGSSTNKGRRRGVEGKENFSPDELLVNASSDVTAALRRTHQLMQSELSRSQFAHDTLQQSTAALSSLSENYGTLSSALNTSKTLLSSLLRSQKSDTWYLQSSLYILLSVILWLVFRRLLYGPLSLVLWLPRLLLRLVFRLAVSALGAVGAGTALTAAQGSRLVGGGQTGASLITHSSATGGRAAFPTFPAGHQAPSIVVGGGGRGAPGAPFQPPPLSRAQPISRTPQQSQQSEGARLAEEVGRMAERGSEQQQQPREGAEQDGQGQGQEQRHARAPGGQQEQEQEQEQIPRNPKKRMWEEDVEAKKFEEARGASKDEL
ncbi:MAG: hypothetical protein M1819_002812 [Sarea resinae]|nr:MAG: hypothetical protein M1819_002812 [Sarea resinae]